MPKPYSFIAVIFFILSLSFTSCLTAKKMDGYVAEQFNNKLPKPDRRIDSSISVTSSIPSDPKIISVTEKKSKSLPLIVYWKYDYRHTCILNPAIGASYFRKSIYQQASKLKQKLIGQQLELTIEQIPGSFAIVDKGHILLLLIHWHKLYVEPGSKDLIVSYRVLQNGSEAKSGRVTVSNIEKNRGIRFAQSWKSSASEFLAEYNVDITEMTKTAVNKLLLEL
jgi:hypothetical protein